MRILIAALAGLLVLPQVVEARGGGGGGHGGGGRGGGGTVGFFSAGTFGFPPASISARPRFSRVAQPFVKHQPLRVANRPVRQFTGERFDGTGGWPVWGWSGDGYSRPVTPAEPQVIILSDRSPPAAQRVAVIQPLADYAGCHPIPNGYRCGQ